jgi:hypothetical protein
LDLVSQYLNLSKDDADLKRCGKIVFKNNLPCVVEYTELADKPNFKPEDFREVFIANFAARVDQIQTFIDYKDKWLQYHMAEGKKMECYVPPKDKNEALEITS